MTHFPIITKWKIKLILCGAAFGSRIFPSQCLRNPNYSLKFVTVWKFGKEIDRDTLKKKEYSVYGSFLVVKQMGFKRRV